MDGLSGGLLFVLVVGAVVIGLLWILLPFAVFGLKDLVRAALEEQRRTNELLAKLADRQGR